LPISPRLLRNTFPSPLQLPPHTAST
jgi:hypothetical protein